jgi:hypothetical protein
MKRIRIFVGHLDLDQQPEFIALVAEFYRLPIPLNRVRVGHWEEWSYAFAFGATPFKIFRKLRSSNLLATFAI